MTPTPPTLLLDTCAIINLSYCSPIATLFKTRYAGRAGWTRAVQTELTRQRSRKPPHPQAGRASNWATSWLPSPIEIVDHVDQSAIAMIQTQIAVGSDDDNLDHLGEASSIHLLAIGGVGRLISDDHGARAVARHQYQVRASSTVGVLSELLARGNAFATPAGAYRHSGSRRLCDTAAVIAPVLQTAAYVLSPDHTQVLLMHRNKWAEDIHLGKYLSLGGRVEPNEDVLTCARREVYEESGLTTADLMLRGTVLWTGFGTKRLDYLCFVFRADAFSGTPHDGNEEGTLEWVPIDDLASRPMWDSDHLWLPMVFDDIAKPFYGVMPYDGHEMLSWSFQR